MTLGTGKTHTLIEIIRQFTTISSSNPKPLRLLVCGASNLSVDNILERLLALPAGDKGEKLKVTRIGHPARVMAHEGILDSTLEVKATRTDQVRKVFLDCHTNQSCLGGPSERRQKRVGNNTRNTFW